MYILHTFLSIPSQFHFFSRFRIGFHHYIISSQPMLRAKGSACSRMRSCLLLFRMSTPKMASAQKGTPGNHWTHCSSFKHVTKITTMLMINNRKDQDLVTSHNSAKGMDPGIKQKPAQFWTLTAWSALILCLTPQQINSRKSFQIPTSISEGNPTCQVVRWIPYCITANRTCIPCNSTSTSCGPNAKIS